MSELSSNLRARAASLYRMQSVHELQLTSACPHLEAGEHIDSHKDELYGMLAQICNRSLAQTLELREQRGKYGLMAPGTRFAKQLPSERHLHRFMIATLGHDTANVQEEIPELVNECNEYLQHLNTTTDPTVHPSVERIMAAGIHTAKEAMDMTYSTLSGDGLRLNVRELKASWRTVLDLTRLSIKELIVLPTLSSPEVYRHAIFNLDESNIASFCVNGLRSTDGVGNIPDRTTIGCPVSFEPVLVRELWDWYVDLRSEVAGIS